MMKRLVLVVGLLAALTSPADGDDAQKEHQQFLRDASQVLYSQDEEFRNEWRLRKWRGDIHLVTVANLEAETIVTDVFRTLSATAKLGFTRTSLVSITDTYPPTGNALFIALTQAEVFKTCRTEIIQLLSNVIQKRPGKFLRTLERDYKQCHITAEADHRHNITSVLFIVFTDMVRSEMNLRQCIAHVSLATFGPAFPVRGDFDSVLSVSKGAAAPTPFDLRVVDYIYNRPIPAGTSLEQFLGATL